MLIQTRVWHWKWIVEATWTLRTKIVDYADKEQQKSRLNIECVWYEEKYFLEKDVIF